MPIPRHRIPYRVGTGTERQPGRDYGPPSDHLPPRVYNGPVGVRSWDRDAAFYGYTLFSPAFGSTEYLIDMNGRVVHEWPVVHSQWAELDPDGTLFWDNYFGGVFESDVNGNVVWGWHGRTHHDFHRYQDGSILTLYQKDRHRPDIFAGGPIQDDLLLLIDRDTRVHWEWWLSDHIEELVGLCGIPYRQQRADWAHTNTVTVLPKNPLGQSDRRFRAGNYLLSHRQLDVISIVDQVSREIVWAWGPGVLDGQHQAQMLANGNILLFDNGTRRGWSSVREFDPRNPDQMVWEYSAGADFFSPFRAGQQRLPNGNTLICESDCGHLFEVTPKGRTVWDFYSPYFGGQYINVYRAARYPPELVEPWLEPEIVAYSRTGRR